MCWSLSLQVLLRPLLGALALGGGLAAPDYPERSRPSAPTIDPVPVRPERLTAPASGVRCEWFQVSRASDPEGGPVAAVRLIRLDAADYTLLERDVTWRAEGWRVHHTERLGGRARRLSWREQGPRGAWAWTADWDLLDPSGGRMATIIGHGWARPTHERAQADAPWIGVLEWLEAARAGAQTELGPVAWLTPAHAPSGTAWSPANATPATGWPLETSAADGPEGRALFAGGALVSFELGASELRATPIAEVEYQRLVGLWAWRPAARHPFVEAALRRDDTLRRLAERGDAAIYVQR